MFVLFFDKCPLHYYANCECASVCLSVCPVPHSNLYIVVSPLCVVVDYLTLKWLNEFMLDLAKRAVSLLLNEHTRIWSSRLSPRASQSTR